MSFKEQAIKICKNFAQDGLYILPSIPQKKLDNATEYFPIDESDDIFCLIDCTVFGSCKNGLAFGLKGIYWKNDWATSSVDSYQSWDDLINVKDQLSTKIGSILNLGPGNALSFSGSSVKNKKALKLLLELMELYENCASTALYNNGNIVDQPVEAQAVNTATQKGLPNYTSAIIKLAAVYATDQGLNDAIINLCVEYIQFDEAIQDKAGAINLLQENITQLTQEVPNALKKLQVSKILAELKQQQYTIEEKSHINALLQEFNQLSIGNQHLLEQI